MIHLELGIKSVDGVYWTLLYELKFYFLMLILYYFNFLKKVNIIAFLFLVLIIVLNLFSFEENIIYKILNKVFIFNFLYLFIAGIMFYKIMNKEFNIIVFINLILSFYISVDNKDSSNFVIFTFIYIMFLFLSLNKLNFINSKYLIFLGSISYSLYLIHQNIGYIILNAFKENNISLIYGTITSLICVIILATMITYLFEKPIIVNLKKLYKKRKSSKIC
jgi:peptidoglycan/LPS O-acetylase OafA/YrhL